MRQGNPDVVGHGPQTGPLDGWSTKGNMGDLETLLMTAYRRAPNGMLNQLLPDINELARAAGIRPPWQRVPRRQPPIS